MGKREGYGGWLFVAFVVILYAYAMAGYGAARSRPDAPLADGMLAGFGAFAIWLLVRLAVPLVRGDRLGFGIVAVVTNALFAIALGVLGGIFAVRVVDRRPQLAAEGPSEPAGAGPRRPVPAPSSYQVRRTGVNLGGSGKTQPCAFPGRASCSWLQRLS